MARIEELEEVNEQQQRDINELESDLLQENALDIAKENFQRKLTLMKKNKRRWSQRSGDDFKSRMQLIAQNNTANDLQGINNQIFNQKRSSLN